MTDPVTHNIRSNYAIKVDKSFVMLHKRHIQPNVFGNVLACVVNILL